MSTPSLTGRVGVAIFLLMMRWLRSGQQRPWNPFDSNAVRAENVLPALWSPTIRIVLYQKLEDLMTQYEAIVDARVTSARETIATLLKLKAKRLEAEILLE